MAAVRFVFVATLIARVAAAADLGELAAIQSDGSPYDDAARQRTARHFYASHRDAYDFLIVFPTFNTSFGQAETFGLHTLVRNDVSGIGKPIVDRGNAFGSPARLKGYIDIGLLRTGVADGDVQASVAIIAHEVAHQWSASIRFRDPQTGLISGDLLGHLGAHWSFFLDSDADVLYGSEWESTTSGFRTVRSRDRYSDLTLYLMGLLRPAELPPVTLLRPSSPTTFLPTDLPPADGTVIQATPKTITLQDIVAAEGARVPSYDDAGKAFRAAFVILTAPGQQPTPAQLAYVDEVRRAWLNQFFLMTRGRAVMEVDLVEPAPVAVSSNPNVRAGVDYLLASQGADGAWRDTPATAVRDTAVAIAALLPYRGEAPVALSLTRARTFLSSHSAPSLDGEARRAAALLQLDSTASVDTSFSTHRSSNSGVGLAWGYEPTPLDTVIALDARRLSGPVGEADPDVQYLFSRQLDGGAWPLTPGGPGRVDATALAASALRETRSDPASSSAVNRALAFLRTKRDSNGAFVDENEVPSTTALAIAALDDWRKLTALEAQAARERLLSQQAANGSWRSSSYETAVVVKSLALTLVPNLNVRPDDVLLSRATVHDGEPVSLTATIRNDGAVPSAATFVQVLSGTGQALTSRVALPSITGGAQRTVTLLVDTNGQAGTAQIFLVVDPDGALAERRKDDNRVAVPLTVQPTPAAAELHVAAGSISTTPPAVSQLPQSLIVSAQVANVGAQGATGVAVSVIADGQVLGTTSVDLGPQFARSVQIPVVVAAATGDLTFSVVVDAANLVSEANESNNSLSSVLPFVQTTRASLVSLTGSATSLTQGQDLTLTATVANGGTMPIFGGRVVIDVLSQGQLVERLPGANVAVPQGTSRTVTALWRARTPGAFDFVATLTVAGDGTTGDDTANASATVIASTQANLAVLATDATLSPDPPLAGQPVTVTARVRNTGAVTAPAFTAVLKNLATGQELTSSTLGPLAAGGVATLSAVLTPPSNGRIQVLWQVDTTSVVSEFDETDNTAVIDIEPVALADLAVSGADVQVAPSFPKTSEAATVTVSVTNRGGQTAAAFDVRLSQGAQTIGTSTVGPLAPGQSTTATFNWTTPSAAGPYTLVAVVDPAATIVEQFLDNNRAERPVNVQDSVLALSEPFFSPNGDGVKDTTAVQVRLGVPTDVVAIIKDSKGIELTRLSASGVTTGELTWDGRSAQGALVRDGKYEIEVKSGAIALGRLDAVVDNNRSPLTDAIGTPYLTTKQLGSGAGMVSTRSARPLVHRTDRPGIIFSGSTSAGCVLFSEDLFGSPRALSTPETVPSGLCPDSIAASPDMSTIIAADRPTFSNFFGAFIPVRRFNVATRAFSPVVTLGGAVTTNFLGIPGAVGHTRLAVAPTGSRFFAAAGFYVNPFISSGSDEPGEFSFTGQRLSSPFLGSLTDVAYRPAGVAWIGQAGLTLGASLDQPSVVIAPASMLQAFGCERPNQPAIVGGCDTPHPTVSSPIFDQFGPRFAPLPGQDAFIVAAVDGLSPEQLTHGGVPCSQLYSSFGFVPSGSHTGCVIGRGPGLFRVESTGARTKVFSAPDRDFDQFTNRASLAVSPDGRFVAFAYTPSSSFARDIRVLDLETGLTRTLVSNTFPIDVKWSPEGSFVTYRADPNIVGGQAAVATTANLATTFTAFRTPGGQTLTFTGTAQDLNFDQYELTARPAGSTAAAIVIGGGVTPVVNGTLATWTPLSPGLYEVTLTTRDKAGNRRSVEETVGWSTTPPLVSVSVAPSYISPNGDGEKDNAAVTYTTSIANSTLFTVESSSGQVVRSFPQTQLAPGTFSFLWDGRDQNGLVTDGTFTVKAETFAQPVTVDTVAPAVSLTRETFEIGQAVAAGPGGPKPYPTVIGRLKHRAEDAHFDRWFVESAADAAPTTFAQRSSGAATTLLEHVVRTAEMRGRRFRVRAVDLAGNAAVTSSVQFPEQLFLTALGPAELIDASNGTLDIDGHAVPRIDLLESLATASLNFAPRRYAFALATSVADELVSYAVAYRPAGTGAAWFVDVAGVTMRSETVIEWDARAIPAQPLDIEIRAIDAQGRTFTVPLTFQHTQRTAIVRACMQANGELRGELAVPLRAGEVTLTLAPNSFLLASTANLVDQVQLLLGPASIAGSEARFPFAPVGTSSFTQCVYTVRAHASTLAGENLDDELQIDVCGQHATPLTVSGGQLRTTLTPTFRQTPISVDTFIRAPGGSWTFASSMPGFTTPTEASINVGGLSTCGQHEIRWVTHLPGGVDSDTASTSAFDCSAVRTVQLPCTRVVVSNFVPPAPAPYCSPQTQPATVTVQSTTESGATLTSLTAWVQTPLGPPLQPLAVTGFAPGTSSNLAQVAVPTFSLPFGAYVVGAELTDSAGAKVRGTGPAVPFTSSSPPFVGLGAFTSPACAQPFVGPDGAPRRGLPVQGFVSSNALSEYSVLVGTSLEPRLVVSQPGTALSVGPDLGFVDLTGIPSGAVQIVLGAREKGGASACSPPETVVVDTGNASVDGFVVAPPVVSPDGDGLYETASASFSTPAAGSVQIVLKRPTGDVTLFSASHGGGALTAPLPLPALADGQYSLEASLASTCGTSATASATIEVDTLAPLARIDAPAAGATVGGSVDVAGEISDRHLSTWTLAIGRGAAPTSFVTVATAQSPRVGSLGVVDTASLAPDTYVLRLVAEDSVGHTSETTRTILVAPANLLTQFALTRSVVSPNGDGRRDDARATGSLQVAASLTIEVLNGAQQVVAVALPATPMTAGSFDVPLSQALLATLADGRYEVRATATAGATNERSGASLEVDRAAPAAVFIAPAANAFLDATDVHVRVDGATHWSVAHLAPGASQSQLAEGNTGVDAIVGSLSNAADGLHELRLIASDDAENETQASVTFTIDRSAPSLAFVAPLASARLTGRKGPIDVRASLQEANLQALELKLVRGAVTTSLATVTSVPPSGLVTAWDASSVTDGPATLTLTATDRAGHSTTASIGVVIDNTLPVARLDAPAGIVARADVEFRGVATDDDFTRYTIGFAAPGAATFTTLVTSTIPVAGGLLVQPQTLPANGKYTFRLSVEDGAGNVSTSDVVTTIQAGPPTPPAAPTGLVATIVPPNTVQLAWQPSATATVVSYRLRRGTVPATLASDLIGTSYTDTGLSDGTYVYDVIAIDDQGLESAPSAQAGVVLDRSAPVVSILRPADGARAGGLLEIIGTASGGPNFQSYSLYLGTGANERLLATSPQPVSSARLGTADLRTLTEGSVQTLRLTATSLYGGTSQIVQQLIVDNTPPAAPVLSSATATGTSVTLSWSASPSPDVRGYLVLRNEQIANAPGGSSGGDITPWLLPASSVTFTHTVADGLHQYKVLAVDQAFNLSAPSNVRSVVVDTRAPQAVIVTPVADAVLRTTTQLLADSEDLDLASVQFEARLLGAPAFAALGAAVTSPPFALDFDPGTLSVGTYELRAVATDHGGRVDAAPPAIRIFVERALSSPNLTALVNANTVTLQWSGASATSTASYTVVRNGGSVTTLGAGALSFVQSVGEGTYTYRVRATSLYGAQVESQAVTVRVYRPTIARPAQLHALPAQFTGGNVTPGATVRVYTQSVGGSPSGAQVATAVAGVDGRYSVSINTPEAVLVADAIDPTGNTSLMSAAATTYFGASTSLALVSQTGSNLQLQVSLTTPTSFLQQVQLWRSEGSGPPQLVDEHPSSALTFDDRVPAGTYTYHAVAVLDYPGPESNSVTVTVVSGEPAPVLTAALDGNAEAVHLEWQSPSTPPNFAIERTPPDGGPFAPLTYVSDTSYVDSDLEPATEYRYRVRFDDGAVLSPWSNIATVQVPGPPVLRPIITSPPASSFVTTSSIPVTGLSRTKGVVEVLRTGANSSIPSIVATAPVDAGAPTVVGNAIDLQGYTPAGEVAVDPTGRFAAFVNAAVDTELVVVPISDPRSLAPPQPVTVLAGGYPLVGRVRFAPNGERLVILAHDAAAGNEVLLYAETSAAGLLHRGQFSCAHSEPITWAADSQRIAFPCTDSFGTSVGLYDLVNFGPPRTVAWLSSLIVTGIGFDDARNQMVVVTHDPQSASDELRLYTNAFAYTSVLFGQHLGHLAMSPTGDVAAIASSPDAIEWTLQLVDLATEAVTASVTSTGADPVVAWRSDGARFAFVVTTDDGQGSSFLELGAAAPASPTTTTRVTLPGPIGPTLGWTPDTREVLLLADGQLTTWRPGGALQQWGALSSGALQWSTGDGPFIVRPTGAPELLWFGLPFSTTAPLLPQLNQLTARVVDLTAVVGPSTAPVEVHAVFQTADLAVTAELQPRLPSAQAPAHVLVHVANLGDLSAAATQLRVSVVSAGGGSRTLPLVPVSSLAGGGGSEDLLLQLDLTGLSGAQTLVATVDPDQTVDDPNRANNVVQLPFDISPAPTPSVTLTATIANDTVTAHATAFNPGTAIPQATVRVLLESPSGTPIITGTDAVLSPFPAESTHALTRTFDVSSLPSGNYQVAVELRRGGVVESRATSPVVLVRTLSASVALTSARASYTAGETVGLEMLVRNTSSTEALQGAQLELRVASAGNTMVFGQQLAVPTLAPGSVTTVGLTIPSAALAAGAFTASARLIASSVELATSSTSFAVTPSVQLTGSLSVAGTSTSPPRVNEGAPLHVSLSITNAGQSTVTAVEAAVTLVDPDDGSTVRRETRVLGDIAPATAATTSIALGVPPSRKTYGLALSARRGTGAWESLFSTPLVVVDGQPPSLTVPLTNGQLVQGTLQLAVHAEDSTGVAAVRVSVDGLPPTALTLMSGAAPSGDWAATVPLVSDGLHSLVISAVDVAGHDGLVAPSATNPVSLTIEADGTPPQLFVAGVTDGATYGHAVAPTFTATDAHAVSVSATLDGIPFTSGQTVTDGNHALLVTATDAAFNVTSALVRFTVDTVAPALVLTGIDDGQRAQPPVTLSFFASDARPTQLSATLDGQPLTSGAVVTALGLHTWFVRAEDSAGNVAQETRTFELVSAQTTVSIAGVSNGQVTRGPVTPVITATGAASVTAVLDGAPFTSGTMIATEGTHVLTATATSSTGTTATRTVTFAIDLTAPVLSLQGPANGSFIDQPTGLVYSASDLHLLRASALLDGQPIASGGLVLADGPYTWVVEAEDAAHNITRETRTFNLDTVTPVITIAGVIDGQLSAAPVTINVTVTEANPATVTITLDGAPFTSGDTVSAEGDHTLVVQVLDRSGHFSSSTVAFAIDTQAPLLTLAGVADGQVSRQPVTLTWSTSDAHPSTEHSTLDGVPFTSGDTVSSEGVHVWVVEATDALGHQASQTRTFTLDFTAPVISIAGVTDGQITRFDVTPVVTVTGATGVELRLDGAPFASGTTVTTEGPHTLAVTASDAAGNQAQASLAFDLDKTAPALALSGVADGQVVSSSVTLVFSASDRNLTLVTGTLDGAPIASGTTISTDGLHTWVVTASDAAGNFSTETRVFTVQTGPVITITGVTDGQLTRFEVTPIITITGAATSSVTLDGQPFTSGTTISTEGSHTLAATATSSTGVAASRTSNFEIDKTPPVLTLTGVAHGDLLRGPVTLVFAAADLHPGTTNATLDGAPIASGDLVSADGVHVWRVTATDAAGNLTTEQRTFELDATPPVITVTGVVDGQSHSAPVAPAFSATDPHLQAVTATLNGAPFASGTVISAAGNYTLVVTATDTLGNTATKTVSFAVVQAGGTDCRKFDLIAAKAHSPSTFYDGTASFSPRLRFPLPSTIAVTTGSAGNMDATLTFTLGAVSQSCLYRGAVSYDFVSCTAGLSPGAIVEADSVLLHLVDGSHSTPKTIAHAMLTEAAPCRGERMRPPFHFAACGFDGIEVTGSATVGGSIASNGDVVITGNGNIQNDVVAGGDLTVTGSASVGGELFYGDQLTGGGNVSPPQHVTPPPLPCECGYDVDARVAEAAAANNNNLLNASFASAFSSGRLVVSSTLTLPAGRYHLLGLTVKNSGRLLTAGSDDVELFVDGPVDVQPNAVLGSNPAHPVLVVARTANVSFNANRREIVQLYVPRATLALQGRVDVEGAVTARALSISGNADLELLPGPQSSPPHLTCP